jgi:hypothetical protein
MTWFFRNLISDDTDMNESVPTKPPTNTNKARRRDTDDSSRAERKRIQDRLAQRATRERTKNRIAYLEERLSSLEANDKHTEITHLTRTIDTLRGDNDRLRNAFLRLRATIDQAMLPSEDSKCRCAQTPCTCRGKQSQSLADEDPTSVSSNDPMDEEAINSPTVETPSAPPVDEYMSFDFNPNTLLEMFDYGPSGYQGWTPQSPSPFDYRFPPAQGSGVTRVAADVDKWHVSNGAFINCLDLVKRRSTSASTLDMQVPLRATMFGWENAGPEALHPIWSALRDVDQRVFGTWTSKAQRIALMFVCQTLIQYRENPTKENLERVPVFLRPRPSQDKIQHPAVIDFLIWPSFRDRLVVSILTTQ